MNEVNKSHWRDDPLIKSGITLLQHNCKCNGIRCSSSTCILFGDCARSWDLKRVIKKRMMKKMNCNIKEFEEFLFDTLI